MAEISTIARPYAQAAFDVACSESALPQWDAFLSAASVVAAQPEVRALTSNPRVTSAQVLSLFEAAVSPLTSSMRNFLAAISSEGRVDALVAIHAAFGVHKNALEGSANAHLVSAYAMSEADVADLMVRLEGKLNVKLKPVVSVDASLIGGFCVTVGDEVLDMSVRTGLERMKTALTA